MDLIRIENHEGLVRDLNSKAILTTNMSAAEQYKRQSKVMENSKASLEEVSTLKEQVSELKAMLGEILRKLNDNPTN